jgi:hypothetical protein
LAGMVRSLVGVLLTFLVCAATAAAQTVTRGSTLENAPMKLSEGNDCSAYFISDGSSFGGFFVPSTFLGYANPYDGSSCTYYQGFVFGSTTDPRSGFVGQDGVVRTVTVRAGNNPAPLRFVILRQLTNAQNGAVSGEPKCCFFVGETAPMQPAPNTTTTFTVALPVETNVQPNVITQDAIGFSAASGGTLPLGTYPGEFRPGFRNGVVTASSFHPALNAADGVNSGGRFASGQYSGLDVLLRYTVEDVPGVIGPAGATNQLRPTDIVTIGGNVLRPIGNALDVILNCLQPNCSGTVNVLNGGPVGAASSARAKAKKIRSLGSRKFSLKKGNERKVKVTLNKLGRELAKRKSTKVTIVVDLGATGKTTRNLTLKRAEKKQR